MSFLFVIVIIMTAIYMVSKSKKMHNSFYYFIRICKLIFIIIYFNHLRNRQMKISFTKIYIFVNESCILQHLEQKSNI